MTEFEDAARGSRRSTAGEFLYFLRHSKKWWLLPILIVLAVFSVLVLLSGTAAAPFIYTLF